MTLGDYQKLPRPRKISCFATVDRSRSVFRLFQDVQFVKIEFFVFFFSRRLTENFPFSYYVTAVDVNKTKIPGSFVVVQR